MNAFSRQAATFVVALLVLGFLTADVKAQIVTTQQVLTDVRLNAWGPMSASTMQIYGVNSDNELISHFSGVKTWDGVIGTAAHGLAGTMAISGFDHFLVTSRRDFFYGTEPVYSVFAQNVNIHQGYGGTAGSGVDLGKLLLQPGEMSGISPALIAANPPTLGTHVWGSGTGDPNINGVPLPFDGEMGTFETQVSSVLTPGYIKMLFPTIPNYPLMGGPTAGYSGGAVYNDQGELAAIFSTATPDFSVSSAIKVSDFSVYLTTPVPEPSTFLTTGFVALYVGYRARKKIRNDSPSV